MAHSCERKFEESVLESVMRTQHSRHFVPYIGMGPRIYQRVRGGGGGGGVAPLLIRISFFPLSFVVCVLVREVGDVRWIPLLRVWKIDPNILRKGKKVTESPPPPPPAPSPLQIRFEYDSILCRVLCQYSPIYKVISSQI